MAVRVPWSRETNRHILIKTVVVMTAEILKMFVPKLVELHNYPPANSVQQKLVNWHTLNCKWRTRDTTLDTRPTHA